MPENTIYSPELLPRRGELNAWVLATIATGGLIALHYWTTVPFWVWSFIAFLYFSALAISLGNWMDRRTRIQLFSDGITYENGLRHVHLIWDEISQVRVLQARWGQTVQVLGTAAHFEFNTLGEIKFRGELRGRTGFTEGSALLDIILRSAGLLAVTREAPYILYSRP
jgi:hypothetical protein